MRFVDREELAQWGNLLIRQDFSCNLKNIYFINFNFFHGDMV